MVVDCSQAALVDRERATANKSIANSGAGRWSNRQHIAIRLGSGGGTLLNITINF